MRDLRGEADPGYRFAHPGYFKSPHSVPRSSSVTSR
ncbi:MAG: hypothetical protein QOF14_2795 [Hyphomicrobiales bacterium]|jgi:hypothetical protein|nr:hypothetical protein [Hyphomicrobiales bacterium]